jgi:hypothetical protein
VRKFGSHEAQARVSAQPSGYGVFMAECCPPGRGCNSPRRDEPCVLTLCSLDKQEPDAAMALARWEELQEVASEDRGERRFRRRAFERARDRALQALAMRLKPWMLTRTDPGGTARVRRPVRRRSRLPRGATS